MRKVGIIGMGACGNNVIYTVAQNDERLLELAGKLSEEDRVLTEDYRFILHAVNSTEFDMNFLDTTNVKIKILGGEGCGKSRVKSKKIFKESAKELIPAVSTDMVDADIIIGVAGLGGGTGSGEIAMFLDILRNQFKIMDKDKARKRIFMAIGVLPSLGEDLTAMANTIEAIKEIDSIGIPYCLIDNDSVGSTSMKDVYEITNNAIAQDVRIIRGDYNAIPSDVNRNMDEQDCKRLFSTPGLLTINKISGIKETDLDKSSIDDLIIKSIRTSHNVQLEKDKIVGKIGVIVNLTESMLEKFDQSLLSVQKEIGMTPYRFMHVNLVDSEDQTTIITILAGLSCPDSKLSEMSELINQAKEALSKKKESKVGAIKDATDWLRDEDEDEESNSAPLEDMIGKW